MNPKPLVSVYIPTHNRARLLARAIDSVLAQTYPAIEIIVVDDGSTDDTAELMRGYSTSKTIRYFHNAIAEGACHARNIAIQEANGTYITGLDDDDYFEPGRIAELCAAMRAEYSFICSSYRIRTGDTNFHLLHRPQRTISYHDLLRQNLVGNQALARTEVFRAVGGFDEQMPAWQDYDLWLRITQKFGKGLRLASHSYVIDKSHPHERISGNQEKRLQAYRLLTQKHAAFRQRKYARGLELSLKEYDRDFPLSALLPMLITPDALRALKLFIGKKVRH